MAAAPSTSDPATAGLPPLMSIAKSLVAGGMAGGLSRTAVAPLERLKILQQVGQGGGADKYRGLWNGLRNMAQSEGLRGMFKGNGTNCVRIVPNSAVKFLMYDTLSKEYIHQRRRFQPEAQLNPLERLGAGAVAGIIAMSATYPLDMVRGRLTVQEAGQEQYRGIHHAATTIIRREGLMALYKGWVPSVIGVIPYVGLNFAVYESLKAELVARNGYETEQDLHILARLGCGACAGATGQTVAYPLDVLRRRLQMSGWEGGTAVAGGAYTGMGDCFVRTLRSEGVAGLFRGLGANYVKVVPSIAIAFVTYEQVKVALGVEIRIGE